MNVVVGIDIGGSTTKIVGFRKTKDENKLMPPLFVRATDPITSIYGAFGKFIDNYELELNNIEKVMITGVGSSYVAKPIYGLPSEMVPEFRSTALGGLYLSGLEEAVVVSMGTGTAVIYAKNNTIIDYLGGTGIGGGTLMGLSKKLLGMDNIEHIQDLADEGNLKNIDLRVSDIVKNNVLPDMPTEMTAANFGKLSDIATKSDIALGIINMVFETIAMIAIFAARTRNVTDIVLTGNLTTVRQARNLFKSLSRLFDVNFIIPDDSQYGTVIGAALSGL
ncbi:MAG: type II pantothenate kinase [Clostridiales bacterium]|jgi:type II pantothenate kinase|nr:type II pantothenate kinase [Clostridiales bacterium]